MRRMFCAPFGPGSAAVAAGLASGAGAPALGDADLLAVEHDQLLAFHRGIALHHLNVYVKSPEKVAFLSLSRTSSDAASIWTG